MIIHSEPEMINFGENLAKDLVFPSTIELIGDIGVGKTTLVKGIAKALGITEPITSPSFTICKTYPHLTHFDFYRLPDPGIMQESLNESINDPNNITIIEWAETVKDILPANRIQITITYNDDGTRTVEVQK